MALNRSFVAGLLVAVAVAVIGFAQQAQAVPVFPSCQIWVTSQGGSHATLIDSHTSQVSSLDLADNSWQVAMKSDGTDAYFSTSTQGIKTVDIDGGYLVGTISDQTFVVATSPLGDRLYSTDWSPGVVYEYNTGTNTATGRSAPTSSSPTDMVVSPDGAYIYVAHYNTSPETVTKIETTNFTATQHVVGPGVQNSALLAGLAISPDGATLYATQYTAGQVIEIRTSDMSALRTVSVPGQPRGVVIDSTGSTIYVAATVNNHVVAIDTATLAVTATITVGSLPQNLAIAPDDSQLFVANDGSDNVSRIDLTSQAVIETIAVNPQPFDLAVGPVHCSTVAPQQAPTPVPVPVWRVSMDPAGGVCDDGGVARNAEWTSVFVGYRYLPGEDDCEREGYSFLGWADVDEPGELLTLPLLTDPSDGVMRWFVAANHSLVAVWEKVEEVLEDLTGTAPGAFVGGPDRRTAEAGGVVDGYYIPPGTVFGPWMLNSPR